MSGLKIVGIGHAVPEKILTNQALEKMVDTSDEWIVTRTGIRERRIAEKENTSVLGFWAAQRAMEDAGIPKERIGAIIVATCTPDDYQPSTACRIHQLLEFANGQPVMAFDINVACTGFPYALTVANGLLATAMPDRCILVIGAETMSKFVDYTDRNTCILFGDGAGAVVVERSMEQEFHSYLSAKGDDTMFRIPGAPFAGEHAPSLISMDGKSVFKFAVESIQTCVGHVLEQAGLEMKDISYIVTHQANRRIITTAAKKMDLPLEKFFMNIEKYGNTSAASIPIALDEMKRQNLSRPGDRLILVGFGSGLTLGAVLLQW
ncbi:MAG: ketoacyl-ACP synthase III [Clostridiales bacterium]|nr:ketoacyl-ACP synthase III [Clostridiales bacterium]